MGECPERTMPPHDEASCATAHSSTVRNVGARAVRASGQHQARRVLAAASSALTKLPNGCHFRWGTVGGWGSTRLLLVVGFWALWGVC